MRCDAKLKRIKRIERTRCRRRCFRRRGTPGARRRARNLAAVVIQRRNLPVIIQAEQDRTCLS